MNPDIARSIREDIARARLLIRREELMQALRLLGTALTKHAMLKAFGPMRFELETAFGEAFADLNVQPAMQPLLTPPGCEAPVALKFVRGKAGALATLCSGLADRLDAEADRKLLEHQKERDARKQELIQKARAQFAEGDLPKGRAFIQKVIDEFGTDDARIPLQMAHLLWDTGMVLDAADILRGAIDVFPKDPKLYTLLVDCCVKGNEFAKAEETYGRMFRQFGTQPQLVLNLARLYVSWKRYPSAEEVLVPLLKAEPDLEEAHKLMAIVLKHKKP